MAAAATALDADRRRAKKKCRGPLFAKGPRQLGFAVRAYSCPYLAFTFSLNLAASSEPLVALPAV